MRFSPPELLDELPELELEPDPLELDELLVVFSTGSSSQPIAATKRVPTNASNNVLFFMYVSLLVGAGPNRNDVSTAVHRRFVDFEHDRKNVHRREEIRCGGHSCLGALQLSDEYG